MFTYDWVTTWPSMGANRLCWERCIEQPYFIIYAVPNGSDQLQITVLVWLPGPRDVKQKPDRKIGRELWQTADVKLAAEKAPQVHVALTKILSIHLVWLPEGSKSWYTYFG
ncbi:PREDICTED: uncharacterized protein LOC109185852 [Ipomoea nil]|uniref:uncharacterized protein LOC109185852 n=1 Tax=Ipomoea nil TaxID=35883 RepID=UPI000900D357|nr:PREDICTED: uncharacterized protein LOC109185852 [Ipomoea nil]